MDIRVSMLSLVENITPFVSHAQQQIAQAVLSFFPDAGTFAVYSDSNGLLHGLSDAFSRSEVVILGAECTVFLSLKRLLLKVLNLEGENNTAILTAIARSGEDVEDTASGSHALVPKGARLFISEDGFYSGFAVKSGRQHLIVLPLDTARIDGIIQNGLTDYFNVITGRAENFNGSTPKNNSLPAQAVDALVSSGLNVAVASTKTAAFIQNMVKPVTSSKHAFEFAACDKEKGSMTQKEYTAALARQARETSSCNLGASLSNVFVSEKDGGQQFVFVALSDSARSRVIKVFGEPGETPRMLVNIAVDTLFKMCIDYAETGGFTGYPNEEEKPQPEQEKKSKNRIIFWLLVCLIAAVLLSLEFVYFAKKGDAKNTTAAVTTGPSIVTTTAAADYTDGLVVDTQNYTGAGGYTTAVY